MAEVLESFTFRPDAKGFKKYPWHEWMDGRIWKLCRGVDFECDPKSMRTQISVYARRKGLRTRASIAQDNIVFQAFKTETNGD